MRVAPCSNGCVLLGNCLAAWPACVGCAAVSGWASRAGDVYRLFRWDDVRPGVKISCVDLACV